MAVRVVGTAGKQARADDIAVQPLTLSELLLSRDVGTPNVRVAVPVETNVGVAAGVVVCLDDPDTPANFVAAYIQRGSSAAGGVVMVDKCVNGVYTRLGTPAITYSAGKTLELEYAGGVVRVFYDGVQIGVDYAAADATIINNTRHGVLGTNPLAAVASVSMTPAPT